VTCNKKSEKLCDLVGNPRKIIDKLKSLNEKLCNGEISIQNSLELAMKTLIVLNVIFLFMKQCIHVLDVVQVQILINKSYLNLKEIYFLFL